MTPIVGGLGDWGIEVKTTMCRTTKLLLKESLHTGCNELPIVFENQPYCYCTIVGILSCLDGPQVFGDKQLKSICKLRGLLLVL